MHCSGFGVQLVCGRSGLCVAVLLGSGLELVASRGKYSSPPPDRLAHAQPLARQHACSSQHQGMSAGTA